MGIEKWPPPRVTELEDLALRGLSRREIAAAMDTPVRAISAKLRLLAVCVPLDHSIPEELRPRYTADGERLDPVRFPRFEDVTPAEARRIARGAPPSGRWSRQHDYSLVGNASEWCAI